MNIKLTLPFFLALQFLLSYSGIGMTIQNISILYGPSFGDNTQFYNSIEVNYDFFQQTCLNWSNYKAIGFFYNWNNGAVKYGGKLIINPTRTLIYPRLNREQLPYHPSVLIPYLFFEASYLKGVFNESVNTQGYQYCPGIGITYSPLYQKNLNIRIHANVGIPINTFKNNNYKYIPIIAELKVGIALNVWKLRFKKDVENNDTEKNSK